MPQQPQSLIVSDEDAPHGTRQSPDRGTPLIDVVNVRVTLGGVRVLDDLSLRLCAGEHTALYGPNGAGKSTLIRLLRGEQWPDQRGGGRIVWYTPQPEQAPLAGRAMTALVSAAQQELVIGQQWTMCGEELILGGLEDTVYVRPLHPNDTDTDAERARRAAEERVHATAASLGVTALLPRPLETLSQGELRILLVARGMVRQPALLLLDEVTDGLDAPMRARLNRLLEQIASDVTLFFCSHRQETLPALPLRRLRMQRGRLHSAAPSATPPSLPSHPSTVHAAQGRLAASKSTPCSSSQPNTQSPPVAAPVSRDPASAAAPSALAARPIDVAPDSCAASRPRSCPPTSPTSPTSEDASVTPGVRLVLDKATVYVDGEEVLHEISWAMHPGENWLLDGDNGAGKSTLLRLLAGDAWPAFGGSLTRHLPRQGGEVWRLADIRRGVRLVSDLQQATYGYDLSGEDVVLSGLDNAVGLYRPISPEEHEAALGWLERLDALHLAARRLRTCSTGEARRLLLARAFIGQPDLLLLDEPCSGLDPAGRQRVLALVSDFVTAGGQIILTSHHEADHLAQLTHCLHLKGGRVFRAGPIVDRIRL